MSPTIQFTTFLSGVAGAVAMSAAGAVARRRGLRFDLETLAGTVVVPRPSRTARIVGFATQLGVGGVLAQGYRIAFRQLGIRPAVRTGAALGFFHGLAAGAALAAAPLLHPRIPDRVERPGVFMLRRGRREAALLIIVHVIFGTVVGSLIGASRGDPPGERALPSSFGPT